MKNSQLVIIMVGCLLITLLSIFLVSFLCAKDYGTHIAIFDMAVIFMWVLFMAIKNLKNGRN